MSLTCSANGSWRGRLATKHRGLNHGRVCKTWDCGSRVASVKLSADLQLLLDLPPAPWLRHAHASHSLDRGAQIHLVQQTLGPASVATTGRSLHARPTDSLARDLG